MTGVASLPMYDWPEIRHATDALWKGIREKLSKGGIEAEAALDRSSDPEPLWSDPALVLSQTCGYPYATRLMGKVSFVGTPAHAATGASPGHYFSVLIARKSNAPDSLDDLAGLRFAFNMVHSQSGFAAPVRLLATLGQISLPTPLQTGAHRASIQAVAEGKADWAAIDAVTWELAKRHEPLAGELEVFARTPETPALPMITSLRHAKNADAISDAVEAAINELEADVRAAVLLTGMVRFKPEDYVPLSATLPVGQAFPGLANDR